MNPPPPPPHGENPKSSGLPNGKYDIFIIPEHSAGSGFLYLPSLKPNVNSFAAGFACALVLVVIGSALAPAVQAWWNSVKGAGGAGMIMLILAVGVGAWALGRIQTDGRPGGGGSTGSGPNAGPHPSSHSSSHSNGYAGGPPPGTGPMPGAGPMPGGGGAGPNTGPHPSSHSSSHSNGYAGGPPPGTGPMPGAGPMPGGGGAGPTPGAGPMPGGPKPSSWQRPPPAATGASTAGSGGPNTNTNGSTGAGGAARSAWERAREETKKKQEENKAREAEKKRKDELDKRLRELREKEAREREAREAKKRDEEARQARQKAEEDAREAKKRADEARKKIDEEKKKADEAQERDKKRREEEALDKKRKDLEILEKRLKEAREREARERLAREQKKKDDDELSKPRGSTYAFSAVGEKTNPWPRGRPVTPDQPGPKPPSPTMRPPPPPPPSARNFKQPEEDTYSYRPYDKSKPMHKKAPSSIYSQSSYAASHSTSRTTPPPSHRGPYSTKDPDKIVIKAVYSFNNAFLRTPTSQLISGQGPVTDGLILRITTEGLFIDDDVRGVPQREWDVKAWTMKLVEVWCPSFRQDPAGNPASARAGSNAPHKQSNFRRLWGLDKEKPASSEETDALLVEMLHLCKANCRLRASSSASSAYSTSSYDSRSSASDSAYGSSVGSSSPSRDHLRTDNCGNQTGELKTARLHVLRASIRDQEGKKYVFVVSEEESWKVAIGLQRLRKGSQVRALGVSGMSAGDARSTLKNLGWEH